MLVGEVAVAVQKVALDDVMMKIVLLLDALLDCGVVDSAHKKDHSHGVGGKVILVSPGVPWGKRREIRGEWYCLM